MARCVRGRLVVMCRTLALGPDTLRSRGDILRLTLWVESAAGYAFGEKKDFDAIGKEKDGDAIGEEKENWRAEGGEM